MKKSVLACILAAALLTTGIPGGQAAMAQSLTETGTEMAAEETNPESTSEEDVYKRQNWNSGLSRITILMISCSFLRLMRN